MIHLSVFIISVVLASTQAAPCKDGLEDRLIARNIVFSRIIFNDIVQDFGDVSFCISPFSMLFSFALLALYSSGNTKTQLTNFLNVSDPADFRCIFPYYLSVFKEQQTYVDSKLYAKDYVSKNFPLTSKFKNDSANILGYISDNQDFSSPSSAANTMNAWMKQISNSRINTIVSSAQLTTNELIVLLNGVTYSGQWKIRFDPKLTTAKDFYVSSSKTVKRNMMFRKGTFRYVESSALQAKIIEIPYTNTNLTYVAILPNDKDGGVAAVAKKLVDPKAFTDAMALLKSTVVSVTLPSGNFNSAINIIPYIKKQGLTTIFDTSAASFVGISQTSGRLAVTTAVQALNFVSGEAGGPDSNEQLAIQIRPPRFINDFIRKRGNMQDRFTELSKYLVTLRESLHRTLDVHLKLSIGNTGTATKEFNANRKFIYCVILLGDVKFFGVDAG